MPGVPLRSKLKKIVRKSAALARGRTVAHGDGAELVIITGMSGSGKASALKAFEDLGYYCVDNLPVELIPRFAELALQSGEIPRTALVVGTILALINHGQQLLGWRFSPEWVIPMLVTYLVPFSVATYGQVQGKRQRDRLWALAEAHARPAEP